MENKIHEAFHEIKAEDRLKKDTYIFLQDKMQKRKRVVFRRAAVMFASVLCVFLLGLIPYNMYFTEAAYVDIDVNPSIELKINRFGHVIDANAYNADGNLILDNVKVKNKSYEEALDILIDKMTEQDYIQNAELFTATLQMESSKKEEWLKGLQNYIDTALKAKNMHVRQEVFAVDSDTKACSYEQNLSPAKYITIIEAQEIDPTITFDSCRDHSITEIKEHAHRYRYGHQNDSSDDISDDPETEPMSSNKGEGEGHGHGARKRHGNAHR